MGLFYDTVTRMGKEAKRADKMVNCKSPKHMNDKLAEINKKIMVKNMHRSQNDT